MEINLTSHEKNKKGQRVRLFKFFNLTRESKVKFINLNVKEKNQNKIWLIKEPYLLLSVDRF